MSSTPPILELDPEPAAEAEYFYVVGILPLKIAGGKTLAPGDPVYGAENWARVEAWERARRIIRRLG